MFLTALKSAPRLSLTVVAVAVIAFALTACNSGPPDAAEAEQRSMTASGAVVATLIDDQGLMTPGSPQSIPQDPGARTRSGHYATAQQADALESALGDGVVRVNIDCCGFEGAEQAVMVAWGVQAAHDLDRHAPILVRGADLRLAASVVNRLEEAGHSRVWLVTN